MIESTAIFYEMLEKEMIDLVKCSITFCVFNEKKIFGDG